MTTTYIIGIDPGAVAASWAVLDEPGRIISVGDLPVVGAGAQRMISAPLCASIIERFKPSVAIVERVGPMPKQGISSAYRFGRGVGTIEGVLGGAMIPVNYVPAAVWKRHYGLGRDKEQARQKAIEIWPESASLYFGLRKHHGRAEACLIALWQARANAVASS